MDKQNPFTICRTTALVHNHGRFSALWGPRPQRRDVGGAGWSSPVARQAHNLKVAGSNPAPATNLCAIRSPTDQSHLPKRTIARLAHVLTRVIAAAAYPRLRGLPAQTHGSASSPDHPSPEKPITIMILQSWRVARRRSIRLETVSTPCRSAVRPRFDPVAS